MTISYYLPYKHTFHLNFFIFAKYFLVRLTDIFDLLHSRWFHCLYLEGDAMSFLSTGICFLLYWQGGQTNQSFNSLMLLVETLLRFSIADLFVTSPLRFLTVIKVCIPFAQGLVNDSFKTKVHCLQIFSKAYIFIILSIFLYCSFTVATHTTIKFAQVFTEAYLTPLSFDWTFNAIFVG